MSLKLNNLKNKKIPIFLTAVIFCFVWLFIGSMGPDRQIEHESIEDMQKEIDTDCYYFDITQVIPDYTNSRIVRHYWTNDNGCTADYYSSSKDKETGYMLGYNTETENFFCDAYFDNTSYMQHQPIYEIIESLPIEINSVEYKYKIDKNSFTTYAPKVDCVIFTAYVEISIEGINYAFYTKKAWNSEMSDIAEQEILDSLKAEVENGLFERIYNTGCKKDGTKLVADNSP